MTDKLSLIVPCYNEEENILNFFTETEKIHKQLPLEFDYLFIDDGSKDNTLSILKDLASKHHSVHYIEFSRNFGKEGALHAGLQNATGNYITVMDVDMQDPPQLLIKMWDALQNNPDLDIVAAKRTTRTGESKVVSRFSKLFYKIMNKISETPVEDGVRDFRIMRRPVVESILELSERNRFSKGLFTWVGYKTEYIEFDNVERAAGETKWNFTSKLNYALSGFVNFSDAPLKMSIYLGASVVLFDIAMIIFLIIRQLFWHQSVSGWASTVIVILFCFGVILAFLGIIGLYLSTIFTEVKNRPTYIIKDKK